MRTVEDGHVCVVLYVLRSIGFFGYLYKLRAAHGAVMLWPRHLQYPSQLHHPNIMP